MRATGFPPARSKGVNELCAVFGPASLERMPEVMSRTALNAQRRVQLGMSSLSDPLFCPVGTLAQGNYGSYFLLHSQ